MSETELSAQENKMGTMPITKLLISMSLPIMFSMFILALYNIVDSIFVSRISEKALTAVSLAFPVQNLMNAFSIGTAIGANALLAMRLGERDQKSVNRIAMNGIFLSICTYIGFVILGALFIDVYLRSQTRDPEIIAFGTTYLRITVFVSFAIFTGQMMDRLLQATGRTIYTMINQLAGAITNIILDPLMIFGIGPFPEMGMAGAAWATVIGQFVSAIITLYCSLTRNPDIQYKWKNIIPRGKIIKQIYAISVPSILLQSVNSVTTYLMNLILGMFSDTAIAFYGAYFKLNSFVFMPVFGLTNGMVPIVSYNYGAQRVSRIRQTVRTAVTIAFGVMAVGVAIFEVFPRQLLMLFAAGDTLMSIGTTAIRIIAPSFLGAAIAITFGATFQALGRATYSLINTLIRQLIVLIPVAFLLAQTGNIANVWFAFLVAEVTAVAVSSVFMIHVKRTVLDKMPRDA